MVTIETITKSLLTRRKRMQKQTINRFDWLLSPNNIELIAHYNSLLQHAEELIPIKQTSMPPPVFIIGAPRSGTTFVYQLIAQSLDVGYINNFIARFWKAPLLGTFLSKNIFKIRPDRNFTSTLGRTEGISGVHEFGYFWKRFFNDSHSDYAEKILSENKLILQKEVNGMSSIFGSRIVFKNLTCGLRILPLCETFPGAVFIQVKRNLVENAISILKARRKYKGSTNAWWSLVPKQIDYFKKMNVESQIKAQIVSTYEEISLATQAKGASLISLEYEQVCRDPKSVIEMLADSLKVRIERRPDKKFVPSTHLPTTDASEEILINTLKRIPSL